MVAARRHIAFLATGLLILGAGWLISQYGKSTGHDSAWIIGSEVGDVIVGVVVVGLIRLVWVRGLHRRSRVWTTPAVLAVGLVTLAAAGAGAQAPS